MKNSLAIFFLLSLFVAPAAAEIDPDAPPTVKKFEWLRFETQKPDEKSPRLKGNCTTNFRNNIDSLRLAIEDLNATHGGKYPNGKKYLAQLEKIEKGVKETNAPLQPLADAFDKLFLEALLANPLLNFDKLLYVDSPNSQTPRNWLSLDSQNGRASSKDPTTLNVLSPVEPDGKVTKIFLPPNDGNIIAADLHWDADRLLYTSEGVDRRGLELFEVELPPKKNNATGDYITTQIETIPEHDIKNYDGCYSPDGSIIFVSNATMNGVPCIRGGSPIGNLYRRTKDGTVERLTNDQDHDWHPTVLPNGRVMYLRWDYTDTPHAFNRVMFSMNPDGTGQAAMYGSNSYWPNCMFYPKPVPGSSTKFTASVTGHHSGALGGMFLFDTAKSRFEAEGVVQQIPGYKKPMVARIADGLGYNAPNVTSTWPLSDKYFLAACWPRGWQNKGGRPQGIYLMDAFDNGICLVASEGKRCLLEPMPWVKRPTPPVIPDKTNKELTTGTVTLNNVYYGPGTKDVPRGSIKSLRVFTYNFGMRRMGGQSDRVGLDGPWDVRVILGTVPVEEDGSANFTVPALQPIAIQPLDAEGKSVQLMRSWFTCRPGEVLSCVGCHEDANTTPELQTAKALQRQPSPIKPWYGQARGFSFNREVQPVLNQYCVECHNAKTDKKGSDGQKIADLSLQPDVQVLNVNRFKKEKKPIKTLAEQLRNPLYHKDVVAADKNKYGGSHFPPAYLHLFPFVRSSTLESDLHLLTTYDYHADGTRLVQMLKKGHHGVRLDDEAWDRLITWIDLNTPAHGSWREITNPDFVADYSARRLEMMKKYGGVDFDGEASYVAEETPKSESKPAPRVTLPRRSAMQQTADLPAIEEEPRTLDIAEKIKMTFVQIPAGSYVTGNAAGPEDEMLQKKVEIKKPFWIATEETTNELYNLFDPDHDSRLDSAERLHFGDGAQRGLLLNDPRQPVVRVTLSQAQAFCEWLSKKTGKKVTLPTESQWEWAALVGKSDAQGFTGKDFSKLANLADLSFQTKHVNGGEMPYCKVAVTKYDDGQKVSTRVASYQPNAIGLFDQLGNVAEWTTTSWTPPQKMKALPHVIAKGGSWQDRPKNATPFSKMPLRPEMKFVDVGFRVVIEDF